MLERRIIIILGIINSIEATQYMDDLYQAFKPQTYAITKRSASLKITRRVADCCKESSILKDPCGGTQAMSPMPILPTTVPLVLLDEEGKHSDSSYDEQSSKRE